MDDIAIKVSNVSKTFKLPHEKASTVKHLFVNFFRRKRGYEKQKVLEQINLEIKKGEFFGIVGRNGSGKSTLLKLLAGIYSPDTGHIQTSGKLVPFIELGVGFNPELTGRENVYLNGALLGFSEAEVDGFYDDIVKFSELERFMDQKLKNYSSGMQVRLAFAVAIQAKADILLIDEVLAVGDADFQRKCYNYFKQLKNQKKTVIFVSHDMEAVRDYCDKALMIEKGVVVDQGSSSSIANKYLDLFNKNQRSDSEGNEQRWGNGDAVFRSIKVNKQKDQINIVCEIDSKKNLEDVVVGIRVLNAEEKIIAGASTLNVENAQKMDFKTKQKLKLTFSMPNIFGTGTFSIGARIRLEDKVTVCDDWSNATTFNNTKTEAYYPIVCPAKLKVE